jgi:hypothetical protein
MHMKVFMLPGCAWYFSTQYRDFLDTGTLKFTNRNQEKRDHNVCFCLFADTKKNKELRLQANQGAGPDASGGDDISGSNNANSGQNPELYSAGMQANRNQEKRDHNVCFCLFADTKKNKEFRLQANQGAGPVASGGDISGSNNANSGQNVQICKIYAEKIVNKQGKTKKFTHTHFLLRNSQLSTGEFMPGILVLCDSVPVTSIL